MSLQEFLNDNPVDNLTDEVPVSRRLKGKDGKPLKFKIKAMNDEEFDEIRKACTVVRKGRKVEFNARKFNMMIIVNHTINPDFKHAESLKKLGCATPEEYVQRVLLAGEVATLVKKIQELSEFDIDMEALVEEAKN